MTSNPFGGPPQHHHVALSVADLERAIEWYEAALEFKKTRFIERPSFRLALLERDGFGIELLEPSVPGQPRAVAWQDPASQLAAYGYAHYAFRVPDLDATIQALTERNIRFACEPGTLPDLGVRFVHIFDLDGNLLEFVQELA